MTTATNISWEAINAARWQLVEHVSHSELEDAFIYHSPEFSGELTIMFADSKAERKQDWGRIARARLGEDVWYWPNK